MAESEINQQDNIHIGQLRGINQLIRTDFRPLLKKLYQKLLQLNFFPSIPPATDPYKLKTQRLATQVFIICFLLAFFVLLLYASVILTTITIVVQAPDLVQYDNLYSRYSATLTCPCSEISIPFQAFLQIDYSMHQVCSSDFITESWIWYVTGTTGIIQTDDFRTITVYFFQALQLLCQLTQDTISDSLAQFLSRSYISNTLIPRNLLKTQINSTIEQFISSTVSSFTSFIQMMMNTSHVNALLSALLMNYDLNVRRDSPYLLALPQMYDNACDCMLNRYCSSKLAIYENNSLSFPWYVPGFYRGCLMLEALRQSHLECFYSQTCLEELDVHLESQVTFTATPLNVSLLIRFAPDATIGSIIDELMVERWNGYELFAKYYDTCRPQQCSYTITTRRNSIAIATLIIGLIGGLVTMLKLIIPNTIILIRWILQPRTSFQTDQPIRYRLGALRHVARQSLTDFNLFPSNAITTDRYQLQTQVLSTRLFFIAWLVVFIILSVYTSTMNITQSYTIRSPTLEHFNDLISRHKQTLICPCSRISMNYGLFLHIDHVLHPVCSSIFVLEDWIAYMSYFNESVRLFDFRAFSGLSFQGIRSMCQLAESSIRSNLKQLLSDNYISTTATARYIFESQVNASVEQFISFMTKTFTRSLKMIRRTTHYSGIISGIFTNYIAYLPTIPGFIYSATLSYNGCKCIYTPTCSEKVSIMSNSIVSNGWEVPGFYRGCYIIESLFQSTLECLFNQTCLTELDFHLHSAFSVNATPLESHPESLFRPTMTIENIVDALMVDQWHWTVEHDKYFQVCRPVECSYTVFERRNIVLIVTILIGVFGGLTTSMKLVIYRSVWLIRWRFKPRLIDSSELVLRQRISRFLNKLIQRLIHLNLFPSQPPTTDKNVLHTQQISTWVFIITFILSITILVIYTATSTNTQIFTVSTPAYQEYKSLFSLHSSILRCPCSKVTVNYQSFMRINYSLHPICDSIYVTDEWKGYMTGTRSIVWADDFRLTGLLQFQALQSLCELVKQIIIDQLEQFSSNIYISAEVISRESFISETDIKVKEFISALVNSFQLSLRMVRDLTQVNVFLTALMQNVGVYFSSETSVMHYPRFYNSSCNCIRRSDCVTRAAIYDSVGRLVWYVPEFYYGCFTLESLRQSRFNCLFDQTCVDILSSRLADSGTNMDVMALDASSLIRFLPNSSIAHIIDELMVNDWKWNASHENYFAVCLPSTCFYEIKIRNDIVPSMTTLIGLIGGLATALKLIVPKFTLITLKIIRKRRNLKRNVIEVNVPMNRAIDQVDIN